ncbi:MAG: hypothetical protein A2Y02_00155 [Omnitrophica bacterium GWA2_52_12]|nr:MAG: hypothetical protein A2Y02_00155 [Omnitrophica bacterium GWA2_52_12]
MNSKKTLKIAAVFGAALLALNAVAFADDGSQAQLTTMVNNLQKQMSLMQRTIDSQNSKLRDLENRPSGGGTVQATPPMSDFEFNERLGSALGGANKWLKDLSFKGDLRLRYEAFSNSAGSSSETDPRNRFRYRLRFGWEKKFSEDMKVGFSLASGERSSGNQVDPTSTNTTFDNNFNFKEIFIEKAYAKYSPPFLRKGPVEMVTLTAGKQDNIFEKGSSDIIWDRDVKPEGLSESVNLDLVDGENFDLKSFLSGGQFVLDEDATVGGDANLFAYQLGLNAIAYTPLMERPVDFLSAFSYYSWYNYAQGSNFLIGTSSLARGNFNAAGPSTSLDAEDFEVFEYYNEIALYPHGLPVRPYIDWAVNAANQRVGEQDGHAWALGTKIGGINKKGDWELSYAYKYVGSEATPGFNDSDFGFAGHSGKRGNVLKAGYALTDKMTLGLAAIFVSNLNAATSNGVSGEVRDEQQRRFQVDLAWKF